MRFSFAMRMAALALVSAVLAGCAAAVVGGATAGGVLALDRRSPGTQLSDQSIELRARSRLNEVLGERGHINIVSYYRKVLLTGEVATEADRQQALQAVAGTPEVEGVVNELAVMSNSSLSQRSNDTLLTGRVKTKLLNQDGVPANSIKVVTERGTTYLMGRLTQRETELATELARTTSGVQRVVRLIDFISEDSVRNVTGAPEAADPAPVSSTAPVAPSAVTEPVTTHPVNQPVVIQPPQSIEARPLPPAQ